jgi:hypothetical protein
MTENSRWDLPDASVGAYSRVVRFHHRLLRAMDAPSRISSIRRATSAAHGEARRRSVLREGESRAAERPKRRSDAESALTYARELRAPLYEPVARASN